jgi:hypothetical protein
MKKNEPARKLCLGMSIASFDAKSQTPIQMEGLKIARCGDATRLCYLEKDKISGRQWHYFYFKQKDGDAVVKIEPEQIQAYCNPAATHCLTMQQQYIQEIFGLGNVEYEDAMEDSDYVDPKTAAKQPYELQSFVRGNKLNHEFFSNLDYPINLDSILIAMSSSMSIYECDKKHTPLLINESTTMANFKHFSRAVENKSNHVVAKKRAAKREAFQEARKKHMKQNALNAVKQMRMGDAFFSMKE